VSAGTAPPAIVVAARHRRGFSVAATRSEFLRVPLAAFVVSRLIVYVTGIVGDLALTGHGGAAARAAKQTLGPVGSALVGSVDRFDSGFYLNIAAHGFGAASAHRTAFSPLYPLVIRALTPLFGSGVLAGAIVSAAAFAAALVVVHRLTELELGRQTANATIWLLALAPLSFFFTAIYTESLFLLLTAGAVLAARRDRWWLACLLGSLATLTRPVGIVIVVALLAVRLRGERTIDWRLAGVIALPATLVAYLGVLAVQGYGWLAPFGAEQAWGRVTAGPIYGAGAAVWAALRGIVRVAGGSAVFNHTSIGPFTNAAESVVLLVVLVISVAALVACWRRLPRAYAAYAAADLLVVLSSPAIGQPLASFDRYMLTLFPLWMASADWLVRRRLLVPALVLGTGLLVFYTLAFSSWSFVA
jgi:hypothetical protein